MTASKTEIRRSVKALKKEIGDAEKKECANRVLSMLLQCGEVADAGSLLLYHALPDELPTSTIIRTLGTEKRIFLPRVASNDLEIVEFKGDNLQKGAYGIEEPVGEAITEECIDIAIIPGVAFDRKGNRLGRGKGYYDRLLKNLRCTKIGVAFSCQIVDKVPHEVHDMAMDLIVTEKEIIRPQKA